MQTVSAPSTIPPYTPCPGGFITVQTLDDGQLMVESWRINPAPYDSLQPYTEPVHHCITSDRAARADTAVGVAAGWVWQGQSARWVRPTLAVPARPVTVIV